MDEQLDRLMSVTLPQVSIFEEKHVNHEGSISCFPVNSLFFMGKNPANRESKDFIIRQKKDAITRVLDDYKNTIDRENRKRVLDINETLVSISNLIPSELKDEENEIVDYIKESSDLIFETVKSIDRTLQNTLTSIKVLIELEYTSRKPMLLNSFEPKCFGLYQSSTWLEFAANSSSWLFEETNHLFNGTGYPLVESCNSLKDFLSLLTSKIENIERNMEQIGKNMEQIQSMQDIIKGKQKDLELLIKKRNEADKPKKLQRKTCACIIARNLEEQLRYKKINDESIEKLLYRWDELLKEGKKIPVGGYDSARNSNVTLFSSWVKVEFIPYYMTNHIVKGMKKRTSNNESAFNEAARNKDNNKTP